MGQFFEPLYFNVVDQVGMVHSVALDMVAESTKFLDILAGLVFENEAHIGYDLSIMQNGDLTTISCNGCEFVIIATIQWLKKLSQCLAIF